MMSIGRNRGNEIAMLEIENFIEIKLGTMQSRIPAAR